MKDYGEQSPGIHEMPSWRHIDTLGFKEKRERGKIIQNIVAQMFTNPLEDKYKHV